MSTHHDERPRPVARPDPDDDERRIDEAVDEMRAGRGLGGRTLGEEGTTGGTTVGADLQDATEIGVPGHRTPAGHAYDPGMAGRTARGGLGGDLDPAIGGHRAGPPPPLPGEEADLAEHPARPTDDV